MDATVRTAWNRQTQASHRVDCEICGLLDGRRSAEFSHLYDSQGRLARPKGESRDEQNRQSGCNFFLPLREVHGQVPRFSSTTKCSPVQ